MTARLNNLSRTCLGLILPLAVVALLVGSWAGCSTPQERYKTLSVFFDGVPNPDAPIHFVQIVTEAPGSAVTLAILSRHKPYVDRKCAACHRSASGNIMEFEEAYKMCGQCHTKITKEYPRMHGPVAVSGVNGIGPTCKLCHTPHESQQPYLLKDAAVKVCTQCHDSQLLGPNPQQHLDGTSCIQCHYGHGGDLANSHFLRPVSQWPTTQPATQPTTQPDTRPATQPATSTKPDTPAQGGVP